MNTAGEYKTQIDQLQIDGLEINASSMMEAKSVFKQCTQFQKELRQIKKGNWVGYQGH